MTLRNSCDCLERDSGNRWGWYISYITHNALQCFWICSDCWWSTTSKQKPVRGIKNTTCGAEMQSLSCGWRCSKHHVVSAQTQLVRLTSAQQGWTQLIRLSWTLLESLLIHTVVSSDSFSISSPEWMLAKSVSAKLDTSSTCVCRHVASLLLFGLNFCFFLVTTLVLFSRQVKEQKPLGQG